MAALLIERKCLKLQEILQKKDFLVINREERE